jgi:hypothetical protein
MGALRQDVLADETVGPNITWLDLTWLVVNEQVRGIGQGEARYRKYKRLKFGGGQAYDLSND